MRVLVLSPIDAEAVARLRRRHDVVCATGDHDALESLVRDREVLVFRSGVAITAELMRRAPDLRLLVRAGSGFDNVDLEHAARRGIRFERVPEPGARAVAEMTFALMLALARNIVRADAEWRKGRWVKHELRSHLLAGKVLGIIGAGSIGREVGALGAAWGMQPVGCVRRLSPETARELEARGIRQADFDEVVETADFLSIHVPLREGTRGLVGAAVLRRMKPGSFLLNLARGGVVDEGALRRELETGERILGAALDVHAAEGEGCVSPLAHLPNVVLTPHVGATTVDTQRRIGRRVVELVDAVEDAPARAAADRETAAARANAAARASAADRGSAAP